jgi:[ribosomal protein S18]-alanine N-acetyltransferase
MRISRNRKALFRPRDATPLDLAGIIDLEQQASTAAHWSEQRYREIFSNSAETAGRIALAIDGELRIDGFLIARWVHDHWELENLVVSETARRKGLGSLLLAELIRRARGKKGRQISLEVRDSNQPARAFYEARGFQQAGRRKHYYTAPPEDAVVYQLKLV